MSTPTARPRTTARQVLFVALALITALLAAGPAHGLSLVQPTDDPTPEGPDDEVLEVAPYLAVVPDCNPDGFQYAMSHPDAPEGAIHQAQWREAPDGAIISLPFGQASGFVASGQGDFQVRGVIVHQGEPFHSYDWKDVTVFCPGIELPPNGRTEVSIDVAPSCDPVAAVEYGVSATGTPNGDLAYRAQWREAPDGQVHNVDGADGTIPTGEGTFLVRGQLFFEGPGYHASDWVEVTVDCSTPDDDPDDEPRPGTPTFTG